MSTVTYTHDHLVRDLAARILDRLSSQEPQRVAQAIEALGLASEPRLGVQAGLLLNSAHDQAAAINREALTLVGDQLNRSVKENPGVTAIETKDLVLVVLNAEIATQAGKALETKLDKQLKAVEHTGAIAVVVLEQVQEWPSAIRAKVSATLAKHQHPRLFTTLSVDAHSPLPESITGRFMHVEVGEELVPCRKRAFGLGR